MIGEKDMLEIQNKESKSNEAVDSAIHIPVVSGSCPEWLRKALKDNYFVVYYGYGTIQPDPKQKHLDELWEKIQKASLFEPTLEQIEKAWIEYCQRIEVIEGSGSRLRALKNMNPNDIRAIISMLKYFIGENVR